MLSTLALIAGCADQTTSPSDGAPAVVAATVDGRGWQAEPGQAAGWFGAITGSSGLTIFAVGCVSCASRPPTQAVPGAFDTLETLQLVITRFTGPGVYLISPATPVDAATALAQVTRFVVAVDPDAPPPLPDVFHAVAGGRIVVTRFDPFANRAAGTFDFDAADSAGAVRDVRDGMFDVPLQDEPPPVTVRLRFFPPAGR